MNKESLKILLVEDDEDDAFFIKDLMVEGDFEPRPKIKHILNPKSTLDILEQEKYDLCMFDYRLGETNGIELLRSVRQQGITIPIIFLTGHGNHEIAVEAMKCGATDYRTKSNLTSESLFQSIRFAMQLHKEEELRKTAEDQLKESNDNIKAANEKLQNSMVELHEAQDLVLRSEKLASIGRLAAGVCHEILNPLNIISGHVQALMLERGEDSGLNDDMNSIMEEIGRIEKIVGGLLKFSRKEDMEMKFSNVNEDLESVLAIMENDILLDNIHISRAFDPKIPKIKIDANRMRQVFLNLINNARHAMEERGGTLTVSTEIIDKDFSSHSNEVSNFEYLDTDENGHICVIRIKISDTGTGIKQEDMVKLFDPFFTTKPEDKGTGLGLSVCYTIIEKHQGTIRVESEYGRGATFIIDLPIKNNFSEENEETENS